MSAAEMRWHLPSACAIEAVVAGRHGDPFSVLGAHDTVDGCALRVFHPGAVAIAVVAREGEGHLGALDLAHPDGFWSGAITARVRVHVDASGQEAALHGWRNRAEHRMEP